MALKLWACLAADCSTLFFHGSQGRCPRCDTEGQFVPVAIKPARRDPVED